MPDTSTAFEEQLQQEPVEQQPLLPPEETQSFQTPQAQETPQKFLGLFDSEDQAINAMAAVVQEAEQLKSKLRELEDQSQMDFNQRREQQLLNEQKRSFYDRQQQLSERIVEARRNNRPDEAAELTSQMIAEATQYKLGAPDKMIEQKLEQALEKRLGPVMSIKQFQEAPGLEHLRDFAQDAVQLQQAGLPEKYIVELFNRISGSGIQQYTEYEKRRRGYTEPVEVWPSRKEEADFTQRAKNRWAEIVGVNKQTLL